MKRSIVFYLHVHQPYRIGHYTIFDVDKDHGYFSNNRFEGDNNETILRKVAQKSYLPTNKILLKLLENNPEFKLSLSMSGVLVEQLSQLMPEVLESFKKLTDTGRVEFVGETYHHSLAFFYSRTEFETQVEMHKDMVMKHFNQTPQVFRNTELAYNNDLAYWADKAGYKGILAEGWDPILSWHNSNFVYQPSYTDNIKLLMKNYRLSDDIAFRFGNKDWTEWPLTSDKFIKWLSDTKDAEIFNIFMDYETFGEHQWEDGGIFNFLDELPVKWLSSPDHTFMTVSEAIDEHEPKDKIDAPYTVTWADTERDLSAWLGNPMQQEAISALYSLQDEILRSNDLNLIDDWRRLQISDHFYYMCTKWFNDGDIHAYFSPYDSPYEAVINYMNVWHDLRSRLLRSGG